MPSKLKARIREAFRDKDRQRREERDERPRRAITRNEVQRNATQDERPRRPITRQQVEKAKGPPQTNQNKYVPKVAERATAPRRETQADVQTRERSNQLRQRDRQTERVYKAPRRVAGADTLRQIDRSHEYNMEGWLDRSEGETFGWSPNRSSLPRPVTQGGTVPSTVSTPLRDARWRPPTDRTDEANDPGRPAPMIRPGAGPVHEITERAAHRYGFTPEAYDDLRTIPTLYAPGAAPSWMGDQERSYAGAHWPNGGEAFYPGARKENMIDLRGNLDQAVGTAGHEMAHGWWHQQGWRNEGNEADYMRRLENWQQLDPSPENAGRIGYEEMVRMQGAYGDRIPPTEVHARTIELAPDADRSTWPDEIRPYYSGLLRGMDESRSGDPIGPQQWVHPPGEDPNSYAGSYMEPSFSERNIRRWR